jgi:hypothetical protein
MEVVERNDSYEARATAASARLHLSSWQRWVPSITLCESPLSESGDSGYVRPPGRRIGGQLGQRATLVFW